MLDQAEDIIISLSEQTIPWVPHVTFSKNELQEKTIAAFDRYYRDALEVLLESGVPCRVLAPNQPWKTGTLRIKLELILDESEESKESIDAKTQVQSPLDEIRSQIQP